MTSSALAGGATFDFQNSIGPCSIMVAKQMGALMIEFRRYQRDCGSEEWLQIRRYGDAEFGRQAVPINEIDLEGQIAFLERSAHALE